MDVVVRSQRDWFGDPRLGAFAVYLDGKSAGRVLPRGSLELACPPGTHTLRIRQWWYFSPRLEIDVTDGAPLVVDADRSHRGSPGRGFLTLLLAPWRGLSLALASD